MEKIKGFIRSGSIASDSEIILVDLQITRDNDYKKYVTAFYVKGELNLKGVKSLNYEGIENFDDFDIAEAKKVNEFECRGSKVNYWITKMIQLPDKPRQSKGMRWTERRHKRMKEILGWNFLDKK